MHLNNDHRKWSMNYILVRSFIVHRWGVRMRYKMCVRVCERVSDVRVRFITKIIVIFPRLQQFNTIGIGEIESNTVELLMYCCSYSGPNRMFCLQWSRNTHLKKNCFDFFLVSNASNTLTISFLKRFIWRLLFSFLNKFLSHCSSFTHKNRIMYGFLFKLLNLYTFFFYSWEFRSFHSFYWFGTSNVAGVVDEV